MAGRIRSLAKVRKLAAYSKVHEVTINRLSLGKAKLTQDWMNMLGEVFSVPPHEIISAPVTQNIRRVRVIYALEAGKWRETSRLPEPEQFDIMIPDDPSLHDMKLYAGEIRGPHFNLRYPDKSIVVLAAVEQRPGDIVEGKRYHVRTTRADGCIIDTIRCLTADDKGRYWLKPESNHPEHQEWLPIGGTESYRVEIVGRVRGVFFRED